MHWSRCNDCLVLVLVVSGQQSLSPRDTLMIQLWCWCRHSSFLWPPTVTCRSLLRLTSRELNLVHVHQLSSRSHRQKLCNVLDAFSINPFYSRLIKMSTVEKEVNTMLSTLTSYFMYGHMYLSITGERVHFVSKWPNVCLLFVENGA